jgi:hypothetical protein
MNDSQSPLGPAPYGPPDLEALSSAYHSLRATLQVALLMLLILSGGLFVFFLREVSLARRQITELTQVVVDYQKNTFPAMESFRSKLQIFAQSHPDFAAIYGRYFGVTNLNPATAEGRTPSNAARLPPGPGR